MNTSTLNISSVTEKDEDEYYCEASNNVTDESKTAVVAVLSKNTGTVIILFTYLCSNMYIHSTVYSELKAFDDDSNCENQTIIITVLSVLLAIAVVCIVGLVIRNVQLNKKHAENKSKEK